jgi:hypothetical protein
MGKWKSEEPLFGAGSRLNCQYDSTAEAGRLSPGEYDPTGPISFRYGTQNQDRYVPTARWKRRYLQCYRISVSLPFGGPD